MSFGPDFDDLFRVAATYVDRILKGARVVDLPVERSSKFELAVNLRTAKVLVAATSPAWRARGPSSSATDIAGCFDPDYAWHDLAQVWQTPDAGEVAVSQMTQMSAADRKARFLSLGMTPTAAESVAAAINEVMGWCILALYRSAAQPAMAEWGKEFARGGATRPALAIIPSEDPYTGGPEMARRSAQRANAKIAMLERLGHWWMCQDPKRGAVVLNEFYAGLE
jgi:hypothetical protein